jgi:hypothetical protein
VGVALWSLDVKSPPLALLSTAQWRSETPEGIPFRHFGAPY